MREQWSLNRASHNTRWGSPQELANLIVFALSDAASFVNGAVLVADSAMDKSSGPPCAALTGETGYPMKRFLDAP
jgi:Enoyl-(Acyl carrier protein) reductase